MLQVPPDPTRSYQVLGCSRSYQVSPNPSGPWVLQVPSDLTRSHKIPQGPWMLQVPPGPTRSYQVLQDLQLVGYSRSHWVSPDPTRSHQILPVFGYPGCQVPSCSTKPHQQLECSRSHQVSPNPLGAPGPWSHQVPPGPTKSHHLLLACSRSHQISPGPTRSSRSHGAPRHWVLHIPQLSAVGCCGSLGVLSSGDALHCELLVTPSGTV